MGVLQVYVSGCRLLLEVSKYCPFASESFLLLSLLCSGTSPLHGSACCRELIRAMEERSIDGQVSLLEARSRLGGRLWTDSTTFTTNPLSRESADTTNYSDQSVSEKPFPVDLGASWIHGIDHNPLATLAKEAGADFVSTSEQVQMFGSNLQEVDATVDEEMGKLFDDLLDKGADDCWSAQEESTTEDQNAQSAVRWYASVLHDMNANDETGEGRQKQGKIPPKRRIRVEKTSAPPHRQSSDRSIDCEIGKAIAKHKFGEFSKLGPEEHRMLHFYTKNVEYALGANISDLSMKFWAADERHAFGKNPRNVAVCWLRQNVDSGSRIEKDYLYFVLPSSFFIAFRPKAELTCY